jgi:hypothetical protein
MRGFRRRVRGSHQRFQRISVTDAAEGRCPDQRLVVDARGVHQQVADGDCVGVEALEAGRRKHGLQRRRGSQAAFRLEQQYVQREQRLGRGRNVERRIGGHRLLLLDFGKTEIAFVDHLAVLHDRHGRSGGLAGDPFGFLDQLGQRGKVGPGRGGRRMAGQRHAPEEDCFRKFHVFPRMASYRVRDRHGPLGCTRGGQGGRRDSAMHCRVAANPWRFRNQNFHKV